MRQYFNVVQWYCNNYHRHVCKLHVENIRQQWKYYKCKWNAFKWIWNDSECQTYNNTLPRVVRRMQIICKYATLRWCQISVGLLNMILKFDGIARSGTLMRNNGTEWQLNGCEWEGDDTQLLWNDSKSFWKVMGC